MKRSLLVVILTILFNILNSNAQTPKWSKGGDLNFLKGEKILKVVICYDSLVFEDGKSEMVYHDSVAREIEIQKLGKGKLYLEKWQKSKEELFPRYFLKDFGGTMKKMSINAGFDVKGNKYILKVYPKYVSPGYSNFPLEGVPAFTDFRMVFVEEAHPENEVGNVVINQVVGRLVGKDYDHSFVGRFKNCFWFSGMILGRDMIRTKKGKK